LATIRRVEDIEAWKEARTLVAIIYKLTSNGAWSRDFGLRDQIRRAAVSIACNIAEGYARETDNEFCRFLAISRGSANEVKTQAYIALDLEYIDKSTFNEVYGKLDKICGKITNLMRYLQAKRPKDCQQPTADCQQEGAFCESNSIIG
jgi:four helix bundle protein